MRNRRALSPVVASIILIAVTIAVSIAIAYWMGALTFNFIPRSHEVTVQIPSFENATLAHAWIDSSSTLVNTDLEALPFNVTFSTMWDTVTLKVDYYSFTQYGVGVYRTKLLSHEEYSINVTELWTAKP